MGEIWSVRIWFHTGESVVICMRDEGSAEAARDEWEEAFNDFSEESETPLKVEGFCDTADRAPLRLSYLPSSARSVGVCRMYGEAKS